MRNGSLPTKRAGNGARAAFPILGKPAAAAVENERKSERERKIQRLGRARLNLLRDLRGIKIVWNATASIGCTVNNWSVSNAFVRDARPSELREESARFQHLLPDRTPELSDFKSRARMWVDAWINFSIREPARVEEDWSYIRWSCRIDLMPLDYSSLWSAIIDFFLFFFCHDELIIPTAALYTYTDGVFFSSTIKEGVKII